VTTAREQAREAVITTTKNYLVPVRCQSAADAASDVWEPLLREALDFIENLDMGLGWDNQDRLVAKFKESLGDS